MSDKRIDQLPPLSTLADADKIPIWDESLMSTNYATWLQLKTTLSALAIPAIPNITTPYANITALLADQANQITGGLYLVVDASDDSRVSVGAALYAKGATSTATLVNDYIDISQQEWDSDIYRLTPTGTVTSSVITSHNLNVNNKLFDTQELVFSGDTTVTLTNSVDGGLYTITLYSNANRVITLSNTGGFTWYVNGLSTSTINLTSGVSQRLTIQRIGTDLECTLSYITAVDVELQTQTTPAEDYKLISRRGLIFFWNWVKTQAITWTGINRFSNATGTEIAVVKILDGATYRTALSRTISGIIDFGNATWSSIKLINPIQNWIHGNGVPALLEINPDGTSQPGPTKTSMVITNIPLIALFNNDSNWTGRIFTGSIVGYEAEIEQGRYYYDNIKNIRYDCQENNVITRTSLSGVQFGLKTISTSTYTVLDTDTGLVVTAACTITLPDITTVGKTYKIYNRAVSITVNPHASDTINNVTSVNFGGYTTLIFVAVSLTEWGIE